MGRKKRIVEQVLIETVAAEGKALARVNGLATFVEGVAPGDVVNLLITRKKSSYQEGRVMRFLQYSPDRVTPFCSHFGVCGGCKWQHLSYNDQLRYKQQQVKDNLDRIAKMPYGEVKEIIPAPETTFYRNKLEFTFSNKKWLTDQEIQSGELLERRGVGFHVPKSFDKVVDIDFCHLQQEPSNEIRNSLRHFALENDWNFYDIVNHKGLLRNLIIRTARTGELMVVVQFGKNDEQAIKKTMSFLESEFPQITSAFAIVNTKKNETFQDLEPLLFFGKAFITDKIGHLSFKISPKSFFQTNSAQAETLYKKVLEFAELTGTETVYDLYTGTGTIANFVANLAKKVIGIENVEEAVHDARLNSANNQINNTEFFVGDMREMLEDDFVAQHGVPDVIITDPPRSGMHGDVVKAILRLGADRIVYVSCNPATQARDLALLAEKYHIVQVQPVDMFPHTHHVENIVSLKKY